MQKMRSSTAFAAALAAGLSASAVANFYDAVAVGYWVTAADFGGASVTSYVVDVYMLSDDAFEGTPGSGDNLLNVYNWNTVGGAASYFQSFTGTGWIPTNLGGPFDTEALQSADSFVTIGGFDYSTGNPLQTPGSGAGVGSDPNFGGNNAAAPGVDAGWYNSSPPKLIGAPGDTVVGLGTLIGRFSSLDGEFSLARNHVRGHLDPGSRHPGLPGSVHGGSVSRLQHQWRTRRCRHFGRHLCRLQRQRRS